MGSSATSKNDSESGGEPTSEYSASPKIRDYVLLEKLGEGGMGEVYKALHSRLGKTVALKLLPQQRTKDPQAVARFEREMLAIGRFSHPNIVSAFDAGEFGGTHFLVMEYVAGRDLANIIAQTGPLPIPDACEIVIQAANALQHVFNHGLVHRDIKPSNLMLTSDGTVKILDLGLALLQEAAGTNSGELTAAGQTMGTLDYMAPEQCGDSHAVDIRADIYSLGATLYKLLSGKAPFAETEFDTPIKKLMAIATSSPKPVQHVRSEVPAQLSAIVERMMAKDVEQRYMRPAEVAAALKPWAEGSNLADLLDKAGLSQGAESSAIDTTVALKTVPYSTGAPVLKKLSTRLPRKLLAAITAISLLAFVLFVWQHVAKDTKKPSEVDSKSILATSEVKSSAIVATPETNTNHEIAARILAKHGQLKVQAGNAVFDIIDKSQLPSGNLPIIAIDLANEQLDDVDLSQIGKLGTLRSLSLRNVPINDAALQPISNLASLEQLSLNGTKIGDAGLIHLAALAHLKTIDLVGTNVSVAGVAKLHQALPDCWISSPQTLNLLSLVDPSRDAVLGQWRLNDSTGAPELDSPKSDPGRLQFPFHPPREYMLRVVLKRVSESPRHSELCLTFVHEAAQPQALIDSWDYSKSGLASGLQIINSKLIFDRASARRGQVLHINEPSTLLVTVTDRGFAISCDGKLLDEHWSGYAKVVRNGNFSIPDLRSIGLETDRCQFHFSALEMTPFVSGGETTNIWPVTPDFRTAAWASKTLHGDKTGELKGPIYGAKMQIDGRPIWELSQQRFNVHSMNVAGRKHVNDSGLRHLEGLSELEELDLSDTQVTDAGLVHLKEIKSLKKIHLSGTKVTRSGVDMLKAALPGCDIVWAEKEGSL